MFVHSLCAEARFREQKIVRFIPPSWRSFFHFSTSQLNSWIKVSSFGMDSNPISLSALAFSSVLWAEWIWGNHFWKSSLCILSLSLSRNSCKENCRYKSKHVCVFVYSLLHLQYSFIPICFLSFFVLFLCSFIPLLVYSCIHYIYWFVSLSPTKQTNNSPTHILAACLPATFDALFC